MDLTVQSCTRHCAKTERKFEPDEVFYSELIHDGSNVVRNDFCEQAWEGPTDNALGWWKSRMPGRHPQKFNLAPNDILLHYFEELNGQTDKEDVRFVMALLLVRRRIARIEDSELDDDGYEQMILFCPRRETKYRVRTAPPDESRVQQIQEELAQLLFAEAA